MTDCRSVTTPLDRNRKFRHDSGASYDEKRFWQIFVSLIDLTITRPNHRLLYQHDITKQLVGYTYANCDGNPTDHRSTSGFMFPGECDDSMEQLTVALSSIEAEYRGAAVATREAIWLK